MNQQITPIQTHYKGYYFRSRLEARWAVYFDVIGLKWLYEHEGYKISTGHYYLPDFFLPDYNIYYEIKPENFDTNNAYLHKVFASEIGASIIISPGMPDTANSIVFPTPENFRNDYMVNGISVFYLFPSIVYGLANSKITSHGFQDYKGIVLKGIAAAKSARFEHEART
jgi:hypothetical protein